MRAAKVQASLRIRAISPEPPLLAHTSSESRGTFRQKARSLVTMNGWACAVKICHDGMLEDTKSLDAAQFIPYNSNFAVKILFCRHYCIFLEPEEGKLFRDSCSWNLSKCKTFSPASQISGNKHNDAELEFLSFRI